MTMIEALFILDKIVKQIKADPNGTVAKDFRSVMAIAVREYFLPAAKLIGKHMNELPLPSRDDFKKKYPEIASDPQLRKVLLLQLVTWTHAMQDIIDTEWKNGDYSNVFPKHVKYPGKALDYLIWMVDTVKDQIQSMTADVETFTNVSQEEEMAEFTSAMKKRSPQESEPQESAKEGEAPSSLNKTKYSVGAVAGAAGAQSQQ